MIDLYTWSTPNGRKISILLEELGLAYETHPVDIGKDEQFAPDFLKISPNNKIPAIVDQDTGVSVFESGAILIYLAEKTSSTLLPQEGAARAKTLEWLMFQMGSLGPMFGQLGHFALFANEQIPYAIKRYTDESKRLFGVLEKRLDENLYLAGDAYTIADIAAYPWVQIIYNRFDEIDADFKTTLKNTADWLNRIGARPAVERGMKVPA